MKMKVLVFCLLLFGCVASSLATHHSFAAYYDQQQPFAVTGTIVKVDWVVPAVFVHLKVEDKVTGKFTTWAFEAESFRALESGFKLSKDMFKEGSVITIRGFRTRPGANVSETVADPELNARVRAETQAAVAEFEFADGKNIALMSIPKL
jgi:hypothetical protein